MKAELAGQGDDRLREGRPSLGSLVNQADGAVTVIVHGEIDMVTGPRLVRQVSGLFDLAARSVTLDLGAVTFMDSSGLRALNEIREVALSRDTPMFIAATPPVVTRVLEVTNMDGFFAYR